MTKTTEASVTIKVPLDKAFNFIADVTNLPKKSNVYDRVEILSQTPNYVGSTFKATGHVLDKELQEFYEIIEYIPNQVVIFKITPPSQKTFIDRYYFLFDGVNTTVKQVTENQSVSFRVRLLGGSVAGTKQRILEQLKQYLESEIN